MKHKATLPLLILLLVAGQLCAELCMAQCLGMRMMEPACVMHEMSHGHCAMCEHASANHSSNTLSAPETCSSQICSSVLDLPQTRIDHEIKPLGSPVSVDILAASIHERALAVHLRDPRSTKSIPPPFDPLISSLRI